MKLYVIKTLTGNLHPCTESDQLAIKSMKVGIPTQCEVIKKRNIKYHRKFFAFINMLMDIETIANEFETPKKLRWAITISAGYFEVVPSFKGRDTYKPTSISFENMDDLAFNKFFNIVIQLVLTRLPNYCENDLNEMTDEVLKFA